MKPQFILTDGGYVIQELGPDGNYRMVGRVAKRGRFNDDREGERLVSMLNTGYNHTSEEERVNVALSS